IGTVTTMNGHALTTRDETGNPIARHRLAALRHPSQQVADAVNADIVLAVAARPRWPRLQHLLSRLLLWRQELIGQEARHLRAGKIIAAYGNVEILHPVEAGLLRQPLQIRITHAKAMQLPLQGRSTGCNV